MEYELWKFKSSFLKNMKWNDDSVKIWINANKTLIRTERKNTFQLVTPDYYSKACCQPSNRAAFWMWSGNFHFFIQILACDFHMPSSDMEKHFHNFTTKSAEALSNFHHKFFPRDFFIDTIFFWITRSRLAWAWIYSTS